jgi:uncharacterized protein YggE
VPHDAPSRSGGSPIATVTARGDAVVRTEPDEALLWVTLSALRSEAPAALAHVAARSETLISLLAELGIDAADRSTSGITVAEEFDHTKDGRQSLGCRATAVTSIRLTDLKLIGQLISRATDDLAAQVTGPQWHIALSNPARLEAARQAAADARRKAQAYAQGLGAALGPLIEIKDVEYPTGAMRGFTRASAVAVSAPMPVEPGEQEITAAVDVTFALYVREPTI